MLDREKLLKDVFSITSKLFPDLGNESDLAKEKWLEIIEDESFSEKSQAAQSSFLIPSWQGNLNDKFFIEDLIENYSVLSVDGSQIYPDRHISGAGCFLINTGGCMLRYGDKSSAKFFSEPKVFLHEEVIKEFEEFSRDIVDLKREELELKSIAERVIDNCCCLIDGSIIFWQLEAKQKKIKYYFLEKYFDCFEDLYKKRMLFAGYISMPKSRELINLIKLKLCRFDVADCIECYKNHSDFPCKKVDHMIDTSLLKNFLKEGERTTVFFSNSKIVDLYPEHLKPGFVYFNVGKEIVRLEFPKWISQDKKLVDSICSTALSQSKKGMGYPVCLAESHEQAVVKGADREFFYHILQKVGMDQDRRILLSQKAIKKRIIGV